MPRPRTPPQDRFWKFVSKTDGCWNWTGGLVMWKETVKVGMGYGVFNLGPPDYKRILAHRYVWQIRYGPIPHGMLVLHKCDNPRCVKITHLFLGTAADNAQDMVNKRRHHSHSHSNYMPRGKDHHFYRVGPKLTRAIAKKIRASTLSQKELARKYNVDQSLISMVKSGKVWK